MRAARSVRRRGVPLRRAALVAGLVVSVLASCGGGEGADAPTTVAAGTGASAPEATAAPSAPVLRVAAALYPLAWMAEQIGGGRVQVVDLTPPGSEPHDLELGTDQLDDLEDADVVLVLGRGFQPSVERAAAREGDATTAVLERLPADLRDAAGGDPHVWLDPVAFRAVADVVAAALTRADAPGAAAYRAGRARVHALLGDLDRAFVGGLRDCARRTIVTSHAAFGRLAERYDLEQQPIAGLSPDAEPDARRLGQLADLVERGGITTVFTEELVSPAVAEALAREAGVRTDVLDPIESRSERSRREGRGYPEILRADLAALRRALDCR